MKKKFLKISLMAICTSAVLSSCNSEDLQEKVSGSQAQEAVVIENPYVISKDDATEQAKTFLKRYTSTGAPTLRSSSEVDELNANVETDNIKVDVIAETSANAKNAIQEVPVYTINYKDASGKDAGVIVTVGDERFADKDKVLMFSEDGKIDANWLESEGADFFKDLIAGYIHNKINNPQEENAVQLRYTSYTPYTYDYIPMQCDWEQTHDPYNRYALGIPNKNERFYAGCVAVAMAQIMTWHRWPLSGTFPRYTSLYSTNNVTVNYNLSNYDYARIINARDLTGVRQDPLYSTAVEYVANLIAECGYRVQMQYGLRYNSGADRGSYAFSEDVPNALAQMGYSCNGITPYDLSKIKTDMKNKRPVYMSGGRSKDGGNRHAYVVKGVMSYSTGENYLWIALDDQWFESQDRMFNSEMFSNESFIGKDNIDGETPYTYRYHCNIITGIRPNK